MVRRWETFVRDASFEFCPRPPAGIIGIVCTCTQKHSPNLPINKTWFYSLNKQKQDNTKTPAPSALPRQHERAAVAALDQQLYLALCASSNSRKVVPLGR